MNRRTAVIAALLLATTSGAASATTGLAPDVEHALATGTYVYIATERKGGGFGTPAEIWFMWDDGAVWVASPPTTWRAKRIRHGRTRARIAVGSKDGPVFAATGSFVRDPAVYERLCATYARKYPDVWPKFEARFRDGLKDGSRILIRYVPVASAATGDAATTSAPSRPHAATPGAAARDATAASSAGRGAPSTAAPSPRP
jgi:hypothetical protein